MFKSCRKRILPVVLAAVMCFCCVPVIANAKAPTSSNKNINRICKAANLYVYLETPSASGKYSTGKLSVKEKNDILAVNISVYHHDKCGKSVIVNHDYCAKVNTGFAKRYYKKLFGTTLKLKRNSSGDMYVIKNGKFYVRIGDLGDESPLYKIKSIRSKGNGVYQIRIINQTINVNGKQAWGTTQVTVKKSSKSSYGYVLKKLVTKRY